MITQRLFYENQYLTEFQAKVVKSISIDKGTGVILDKTAFYPEGGGQPADGGTLNGISVLDVQEIDGEIVHFLQEKIDENTQVTGCINFEKRFDLMQQHSGEHIVSGFINRQFGYNNVGFHIGSDMVTIDFDGELTREDLKIVEKKVNNYIWLNQQVNVFYPNEKELEKLTYRSKKELSGWVRIVEFPNGGDMCACCGLHVKACGEIGFVKLISVQKFHQGVRVEMVSGKRAYDYVTNAVEENSKISALLSAKIFETSSAVERLMEENQQLKLKVGETENRIINLISDKYLNSQPVIINEPYLSPDNLRRLTALLIEKTDCFCGAFSGNDNDGYKYAVGQKNGDLKELVKDMNTALNGRGGGKPFFAQGSLNSKWEDIYNFLIARIK